ncbi:MAG: thioredoxin [Lysobacterales bacterium]|nr:MAG: thioredoxin [Xanthomonadales bacterium]
MLGEHLYEATTASFESMVVEAPGLVIVDLWATWCGPCQIVAPTLEVLAKQYAETLRIVTVDITEQPEIATKYAVRSVPTLLFFVDGQVVERLVGTVPRADIEARIRHYLGEVVG